MEERKWRSVESMIWNWNRKSARRAYLAQIENPWQRVRLGRFAQGLKRRWRGFFRGARRVVSGIHRDADGFHPSRRLDGGRERETRGNERETGVGCCAYTHFFPRLSPPFLPFSPSFIRSPQSFALFLFLLLYPLYPSILLFLLNSLLVFSPWPCNFA